MKRMLPWLLLDVVLIGAALGVVRLQEDALTRLWWRIASQQLPTVEELQAVQDCADPGWIGLLRVLEQDLGTDCPLAWFPEVGAGQVESMGRGERRRALAWLRAAWRDPQRTASQRLQVGLVLGRAGEVPEGLGAAVRAPDAPQDGPWLVASWVRQGHVPPSHVDPALRELAELQQVLDDGDPSEIALPAVLERWAALRVALPAEPGRELVELALEMGGWTEQGLRDAAAQARAEARSGRWTAREERLLARVDDTTCRVLDPACLSVAAAVARSGEGSELADLEDGASRGATSGPWADAWSAAVRAAGWREDARRTREIELARWSAWIAAAPSDSVRFARVMAALDDRPEQVPPSPGAWPENRSSPWARALVAGQMAELAGVAVSVVVPADAPCTGPLVQSGSVPGALGASTVASHALVDWSSERSPPARHRLLALAASLDGEVQLTYDEQASGWVVGGGVRGPAALGLVDLPRGAASAEASTWRLRAGLQGTWDEACRQTGG